MIQLQPPDISAWQRSGTGIDHVHELGQFVCGKPDVLVTALIHGNELSGAHVLHELLACDWQPRPGSGRVTLAFCNVAAFLHFDAAHVPASRFVDEDLNRVWALDRLDGSEVSAELERARELRPFVQRATHMLDLHSMHENAPPWWVVGPLPRNAAFAQNLQTGVQAMADAGHANGLRMRDALGFGDAAGDKLALLLEAGGHLQPESLICAKNATLRFLMALGLVDAQTHALPAAMHDWLLPLPAVDPAPVHVTQAVVAQSTDFAFTQAFKGGEVIAHAGTVIAHDVGQAVTTPYDDCVLVMPSVQQLAVGVTVVRLGRLDRSI